MKFDLHRLQMLHEFERRGTLAAVAAALHYSPSAISQQLSLLESDVGAPLLEPDGRRVRLTSQGRLLAHHAEAILQSLREAESDLVRSLGTVSGTLRIATFQTAMLTLIPAALARLREVHPALRVEVTQAEPEVQFHPLLPEEYDFVIDEVYPGQPLPRRESTTQEVLLREPMRLAGGQLPAGRGTKSATGLAYAGEPWMMEVPGSPGRAWAMAACREAGFEPDVVFESSDMLVQREFVERGHCVAFLPDLVWRSGPPTCRLQQLTADHVRTITMSYATGVSNHPKIVAAVAAMRAAVSA